MLFGILAAVGLLRRRVNWGSGWVWPVPTLRIGGVSYAPVISDGTGSPRPGGAVHRGVDIMFQRRSATDRPEFAPGTQDGTRMFFAPKGTPVLAAKDGKLWSAELTPRGWTVVIDHGKPFATYYTHMESLNVPTSTPRARNPVAIKAGDVIGYMGGDPMERTHLRHLHFAVWYEGTDANAVDPADAMRSWPRVAKDWTP